MNDVPWKAEYGNANSESTGVVFKGNFSVIMAISYPMFLAVVNSSHRVAYEDMHHLGCVSVVEVPCNCFIIFHGHLYHYGDRAQFIDTEFQMNPRMFAYFKSIHYHFKNIDSTQPSIHGFWCDGCDICLKIAAVLKEKRGHNDHYGRWTCPISPSIIQSLRPGTHVMGNLETLGWAILKGVTPNPEERLDFIEDIKKVRKSFEK